MPRHLLTFAAALLLSTAVATAEDATSSTAMSVAGSASASAPVSAYPASPDDIQPATVTDAQQFVTTAAAANQFEIDSSQLALQKAQTQQVADFASKMIADHGKAATGLQQAASQQGLTIPTALDTDSAAKLKQLQDANGADFEKLYVQMQTDAHVQAVALFSGYAQGGTAGPVKDFATQTLPTLKMHYQMVLALPR